MFIGILGIFRVSMSVACWCTIHATLYYDGYGLLERFEQCSKGCSNKQYLTIFLRRIIPIFSVWMDVWVDVWMDIKKRNGAIRVDIWVDKMRLFRVLSRVIIAIKSGLVGFFCRFRGGIIHLLAYWHPHISPTFPCLSGFRAIALGKLGAFRIGG